MLSRKSERSHGFGAYILLYFEVSQIYSLSSFDLSNHLVGYDCRSYYIPLLTTFYKCVCTGASASVNIHALILFYF